MKTKALLFLSICIFLCCHPQNHRTNVVSGLKVKQALVVSAHPLASEVGAQIMKEGGSAFDAAIAVQFALAVVYPEAGNIGGGGFAVFRTSEGEIGSLDFREKAPATAEKDMYIDKEGNVIPRLSIEGHLAAGVPGSVAGMVQLHEQFGKLGWEKLLNPSITLATNGFPVSERGAANLNRASDLIRKWNDQNCPFLKEEGWKKGDTLLQLELAQTLKRIQEQGREGFYTGQTADLIVREISEGGGKITHSDLEKYKAAWRDPIKVPYDEYSIISMPPPSSGGLAVCQLMKGIQPYDLHLMEHNSVESIQLITELEKRVYADRATYLGDEDYYPVPKEMLISDKYLLERFVDVNLLAATPSQQIKKGEVEIIESVETTHFSIVDPMGNAIGITTTINSYFGCKVVVDGAGFFLNNEMDDFSAKPGAPNQFGLVGAEANSIAPEKRMLSSMTPTIVEKNGKLFMVLGSPGGSTIITSVFQSILNVIEFGMGMQEAVEAKRFHHQWLPDRIIAEENAFSPELKLKLKEMGHDIEERGALGMVDAILVLEDGTYEAGADPRGDDHASGF